MSAQMANTNVHERAVKRTHFPFQTIPTLYFPSMYVPGHTHTLSPNLRILDVGVVSPGKSISQRTDQPNLVTKGLITHF